MKKTTCFLFLVSFMQLFASIDPTKGIEKEINKINADRSLTIRKFDANYVYNTHFDGGGEIRLYLKDGRLVKIVEAINFGYGRVTTTIYLKHKEVIAITETEEDYIWLNKTTLDLSKLRKVFDTKIYVDDWKRINTITIGSRVNSDVIGDVTEYRELLDKAGELLNQK